MFESYKEMSRAVGVKKPQEAQKAKALWKMKAATDAGEEYHARRNTFERFRWFLELVSRFEFDFLRRESYFFERFEFLVCSKFNHAPCGRTCAVACLHTHNSISNVVASVTIHDDKYIYIYIYEQVGIRKVEKHATIVEGQRLFQPNITESV